MLEGFSISSSIFFALILLLSVFRIVLSPIFISFFYKGYISMLLHLSSVRLVLVSAYKISGLYQKVMFFLSISFIIFSECIFFKRL